jgi:hypothetical protein
VELLNVITVTVYTSNRLGGGPEALILAGCLPYVMGAVTYGRKKVSVAVKWDSFRLLSHQRTHLGLQEATSLSVADNKWHAISTPRKAAVILVDIRRVA